MFDCKYSKKKEKNCEKYIQSHTLTRQMKKFHLWMFSHLRIYCESTRKTILTSIAVHLVKLSRCVVQYWKLVSEHTFTSQWWYDCLCLSKIDSNLAIDSNGQHSNYATVTTTTAREKNRHTHKTSFEHNPK